MKKKIFSLLAILFVAFMGVSLVSCGDDDDEEAGSANESALIGTWWYDDDDWYIEITFSSDHKFEWTEYDYEVEDEDTRSGTWSLDGTTVNLKFKDGDKVKMTFDGKKLIYNDAGDKYVFEKDEDE